MWVEGKEGMREGREGRGVIRDREMSKPGVGMDIKRIGEGFCSFAPVLNELQLENSLKSEAVRRFSKKSTFLLSYSTRISRQS